MNDQIVNVRTVAQGALPNSIVFRVHFHLVVDSDGNVISGFLRRQSGVMSGQLTITAGGATRKRNDRRYGGHFRLGADYWWATLDSNQ